MHTGPSENSPFPWNTRDKTLDKNDAKMSHQRARQQTKKFKQQRRRQKEKRYSVFVDFNNIIIILFENMI